MEKDRLIEHLKRRLAKAEDNVDYHIHRKDELKNEIENLEEKINDLETNMRSLVNKNKAMEKELSSVKWDLKETEEGNMFIKEFNQQLQREKN